MMKSKKGKTAKPTKKIECNTLDDYVNALRLQFDSGSSPGKDFIVQFEKFTENKTTLPEEFDESQVRLFLSVLYEVIGQDINQIETLVVLLKNDERVFNIFSPTKEIISKLQIVGNLSNKLVMDFICFLTRHFPNFNIATISEELSKITLIQTASHFRAFEDIEKLKFNQENLAKVLAQNQLATTQAFKELVQHVEDIKKHVDQTFVDIQANLLTIQTSYSKNESSDSGESLSVVLPKIEEALNEKLLYILIMLKLLLKV